jgi:Fur family iron response transcriptional regulator
MALARLLFEGLPRHVTADDLHAEAEGAHVQVSLATVYNTLHQFTKVGLLREVAVAPGRSYFDTNTSDHHHYYFESTGRLMDISIDSIDLKVVPEPPPGSRVERVDVIVRLRDAT